MSEEHNQIGLILKQYRTKRGLTLEKISNKTKISIQNLHHIEEGEIGSIGGKFYQKSFLKAYCNALRIKDTKLLLFSLLLAIRSTYMSCKILGHFGSFLYVTCHLQWNVY